MFIGNITYGNFAVVTVVCGMIAIWLLGGLTVIILLFGRKK